MHAFLKCSNTVHTGVLGLQDRGWSGIFHRSAQTVPNTDTGAPCWLSSQHWGPFPCTPDSPTPKRQSQEALALWPKQRQKEIVDTSHSLLHFSATSSCPSQVRHLPSLKLRDQTHSSSRCHGSGCKAGPTRLSPYSYLPVSSMSTTHSISLRPNESNPLFSWLLTTTSHIGATKSHKQVCINIMKTPLCFFFTDIM